VVEEERQEAPDPSRTSASVTVIDVDERLSSADDVASVVNSASGTVVRRLGGLGDYSAVSIRGSSFRQVQIYLDGIPLNPDGSDSVNLAELPLAAFERIEIYRGNAPASFAAAPIGGVINLVSSQKKTPASAALGVGQYGTGRFLLSGTQSDQLVGQPTDVLVLAELFSTQGDFLYFTDNGTLYNTEDDERRTRVNNDKGQVNAFGRWRWGDDGLRLSLTDALLFRQEGLPGHANGIAEETRLDTQRNILTAQLEGDQGRMAWHLRAWRQDRKERYDDRAGELGVGNEWHEGLSTNEGLQFSIRGLPWTWLAPTATASARRDRYNLTDLQNDIQEDPRLRTAATGVLGVESWLLQDQVQLSPLVQLNWLDNRKLGEVFLDDQPVGTAARDTLFALNPRAGLLIQPSGFRGLSLKANVGRYLRPPDFSELFGDRGGIRGNSDLLPEEGLLWDVGLRYLLERPHFNVALDGAYFSRDAENQIVFIQNSQRTSVPTNFGSATTQGVELAFLFTLDFLDSQSNLTWTESVNGSEHPDQTGKQLPRIPTWEFHQSTSVHWREDFRVGHSFSYTAGNYWDAANVFLAPPRNYHSAFVRFSSGDWSLEGSVLNLRDEHVALMDRNPFTDEDNTLVNQALTDFIGYPLPGRTWLVSLRWSPHEPQST